jgi:ankyrin repeat protein
MFKMSRDNLKLHDLENVDDNDHQQLHRLLIEMFSDTPTEDNELRMVHVLACMVNKKSDNVISNLIDTSATERQAIFMERMGDSEYTALHLACRYNASIGTINALLAIGGRELVMMINTYERTALHEACRNNASVDTINALIAIGGRELVMMINECTALHEAFLFNASVDIINALIAIGGRELVMMIGTAGCTGLHLAFCCNASIDTINAIIAIGGRELVMMINTYECTALHLACQYNASADIINTLIAIGGRELVMMCNDDGCTALHWACEYNASVDIINALIAIGGRELVMTTDADGYTVLRKAICYNASIGTINALIAIGGRELVMMTDADGYTALHEACRIMDASVEIINTLIDIGGRELLIATHDTERTAIRTLLNSHQSTNIINKASSLISSGIIQDQVGGEFGIGGLFNFVSEEGQQSIFEHWNNTILPALEMNAALISTQPILQAAIIARAPLHIIQDIVSRFACIATQDIRGRYPIDVAIAEGLRWGDGMEDIVRAHTEASIVDWQGQARLMINVAALHGLKWENGMEAVSVESREEVGNADALTGLFPFMLAAAGQSSDLSSIYELMLQSLGSF